MFNTSKGTGTSYGAGTSLTIRLSCLVQNVSVTTRESTVNPDNWTYKNELPMNGGNMNGIIGFDALESQFSIYNPNKLNLQDANSSNFDNIPHNDLRKPIVYEN